jgi:hypothetical protein
VPCCRTPPADSTRPGPLPATSCQSSTTSSDSTAASTCSIRTCTRSPSPPPHLPIAPADSRTRRKQAVTTHTQELEALEAKLRETEERLNQARNSPPRRKDSQRRTPVEGSFSAQDKARLETGGSPLPLRQNKENLAPRPAQNMPGALSEPVHSDSSTEYVLVDRPPTARSDDAHKA